MKWIFNYGSSIQEINIGLKRNGDSVEIAMPKAYLKDLLHNYRRAFVISGVRFLPDETLEPVITSGTDESDIRYRISQNGRIIDEIKELKWGLDLVIEVYPLNGEIDVQLQSQIFDITDENQAMYLKLYKDSYNHEAVTIKTSLSMWKPVWEMKSEHLLNPKWEYTENFNFKFWSMLKLYRVNTVRKFLMFLIHNSDAKLGDLGLPKLVLDGYINANHVIPISHTDFAKRQNFDLLSPLEIPQADERQGKLSGNFITKQLLKLCLLNCSALRCPVGFVGFDLIIPVLLNTTGSTENEDGVAENDVTFIGIKIKRSKAETSKNIENMQARLHLVKCADEKCPGSCKNCIKESALESIYNNQISILMSLDKDKDFEAFSDSIEYFDGCALNDKMILHKMLKTGKPPHPQFQPVPKKNKITRRSKYMTTPITSQSERFMEPLLHVQKAFGSKKDIMVSRTLWNDDYVNFAKAFPKKSEARPDGFIHRQFCICTRGWSMLPPINPMLNTVRYRPFYKSLNDQLDNYPDSELDQESIHSYSRGFSNVSAHNDSPQDAASFVANDLFVAYPAYSDDLKATLGLSESHNQISKFTKNNLESVIEKKHQMNNQKS